MTNYQRDSQHILKVLRSCERLDHLRIAFYWACRVTEGLHHYSWEKRQTLQFKIYHTFALCKERFYRHSYF